MSPRRTSKQPPYAMLYGSRMGSMEVYIGTALIDHDQTDEAALAELQKRPLGEWFDTMRIVVNGR